ncbi:hypothetical protein IMG5_180180 [Ichthyophthirius multifiliis]|uniref:Transmembrane protein n=1 Tax=Ichthyophthirius multifiliis TaxID=5932 RepID=G0R2P3_ICHMU|nr:hypothetical protein IMG5_180180 [Ichthyophthirius multifiliis]EGR28259.1 hypothetical protein IMG5_180180 [Ichthyophthirius multifiliis]|eukprot:XP_004027604.1 hypothetical protein IMG5_180180 [Ichthyophthirius multifiliis]
MFQILSFLIHFKFVLMRFFLFNSLVIYICKKSKIKSNLFKLFIKLKIQFFNNYLVIAFKKLSIFNMKLSMNKYINIVNLMQKIYNIQQMEFQEIAFNQLLMILFQLIYLYGIFKR